VTLAVYDSIPALSPGTVMLSSSGANAAVGVDHVDHPP
jgi:hypothetical protein